ncbi:hypothetical protein L210DRAFT_3499738 [Boletus edulis BED1]|uniref:Uncharacterized protein n=1 Tax=Boletus edulis BED1 TaxID=1328754 RepID=A0AAD4C9G8_BOLED|nr:hypothetical protein L210DRAFT_3499738 [Boletus edulis BED1]
MLHAVAIVTAVSYDYNRVHLGKELPHYHPDTTLPMFSQYRHWTWVSTMFVVMCTILSGSLYHFFWTDCSDRTDSLNGTSFIHGPLEILSGWTFVVFISTADLVMILRVYSMWNRSRTILSILLFLYVTQTIITVVLDGIYDTPNTYVSAIQVYLVIPRLVLSAALVIFAVSQTLKQSFEIYKATKQWQPNRYMQKLVGDGILYFIAFTQTQYNTAASILLATFPYIIFYTLIPRFIIGIRELYDRDTHGRFHIDTGFGVRSRSSVGLDTTVSAMVFVDGDQGPEVEGGTDNSGGLEAGRRVHWSGLNVNDNSPIGDRG